MRCCSLRLDGSFRAFRSRFMTCWHVSFFDFALKFSDQFVWRVVRLSRDTELRVCDFGRCLKGRKKDLFGGFERRLSRFEETVLESHFEERLSRGFPEMFLFCK